MWWFPERLPKSGTVVDPVDYSAGYLPAAEELGRLDETNFNSALQAELDAGADLAEDVWLRWKLLAVNYEWDDIRSVAAAGRQTVGAVGSWVPVDTLDYSFAGRGGILDVHTTIQCWRLPGVGDAYRSVAYLQSGIEIDGTVVMEGALGDFDVGDEGQAMEVGRTGLVWRDALNVAMPVAPGHHRVRAVVRLIPKVLTYFGETGGYDAFSLNTLVDTGFLGTLDAIFDPMDPAPDAYGSVFLGSREMLIIEKT